MDGSWGKFGNYFILGPLALKLIKDTVCLLAVFHLFILITGLEFKFCGVSRRLNSLDRHKAFRRHNLEPAICSLFKEARYCSGIVGMMVINKVL
jgi:hypothetical protein